MAFKKLIEVALPIREISAESVRDKSLRHGHISTLHLWWARRPLAAARAIVFTSLVPDPDDPGCPAAFRDLVAKHLKDEVPYALRSIASGKYRIPDPDPYQPYEGMLDTLRNRLIMFIAKWSRKALDFEQGRTDKEPKPNELLDDRSLVKWETSDPTNPQGQEVLRVARELVKAAHGGETPVVLDPFSGGGAIPLEAGRLGCQPVANDYNPVAYLILRATCEYPQKYCKPGKRKVAIGGKHCEEIEVPNVLVHDFEQWTNWILTRAKEQIGPFYPPGKDGRPVIGYFWARTAPCSNPTCQGEIPLLRNLLICNKKDKKVALTMEVDRQQKRICFGIAEGKEIRATEGTMQNRGNVLCPYCDQVTPVADLRTAGLAGRMGERMVAVITESRLGKSYRPVEAADVAASDRAAAIPVERPQELILQEVTSSEEHVSHRGQFTTYMYGMKTWGSLFNPRQLLAMQTFVACLHEALAAMKEEGWTDEYRKAVGISLGLWTSRIAQRSSNVGIWHTSRETLEHPFGRQAIPMTWDYPEANPFSESTGGAEGGVDWMKRALLHESMNPHPAHVTRGDGAGLSLQDASCDAVVTDPPYFDAISYADLSDYFYVWLKRGLSEVVPEALATPLTPKIDEATALKHRHQGDASKADTHFKAKLAAVLKEAHRVLKPDGVISVMFAHQSTKAWTALVHAIFEAGLTVDATWPIDTELTTALKASVSALSSSVTVVCRPRVVGSAASFREVRKEIEQVVTEAFKRFWSYGFRGADLIVACYGPAVGVFGKYERVERANGATVGIQDLLDLARQAARDAIAGEFEGDNLSMLYYVWANLYGASEQAWDDAVKVVRIGGDTAQDPMDLAHRELLLVVDGATCRLALLQDRAEKRGLGREENPPLIDALHCALLLWKGEVRGELVAYLAQRDLLEDGPFWKLAQALFEVLPHDVEDWRLVSALLGERQTLRAEGKRQAMREGRWDLFSAKG